MSRKSKTTKSRNGGKSSGGSTPRVVLPTYKADTATGLTTYDSYSGEEWSSDVVYDKNSENFRLRGASYGIPGKDILTGWWVKYEISDDLMVMTEMVTVKSNAPYGTGKYYVERMVFDLDPATIQGLMAGTNRFSINSAEAVARAEGRGMSAGEALNYYVLPPSSYLPTSFPEGGNTDRSYTNIKGGTLGTVTYSTSRSDESWFRTYEGGKFFGKDWYLNPFGENLL